MAPTTLYGIPNCDSVKKARVWLTEHGQDYDFHDFKKQGVPEERLQQWLQCCGWEVVLNRKGTTWRKLTPEQQDLTTQSAAVALMIEYPSVIKRPVVEAGGQLLVGFDPALFASFVK